MAGQDAEAALGFLAVASQAGERRSRRNMEAIRLWFRLIQICMLVLAGIAASAIPLSGFDRIGLHWALLATLVSAVAALETTRRRTRFDDQATMVILSAVACVSGGGVLLCLPVPRPGALGWAVTDAALSAPLLLGLQFGYAKFVAMLLAQGRLARRIAIVGTGPTAQDALARLDGEDKLSLQIAGCYTANEVLTDQQRGNLRTLLCDARLNVIDVIVLALEPTEIDEFQAVRKALKACVQDVFVAGEMEASALGGTMATLGSCTMPLISQQPIRGSSLATKRAFDVIASCLLLALMAPLLTIIALAVRLETRGPILFRQLRVGYNNQLFYILKFRSMYWEQSDHLAKQQTVRGDKRVTRVGRVLRKLSLDELPQLLNVVLGEMSLVGPRPHAPGTSIGGQRVHTLVDDYACRHTVRPGITGLAQVRGLRGGLEDRRQVVDRIASDLEYIRRWSLWLDIRILLGTVVLELRDSRGS